MVMIVVIVSCPFQATNKRPTHERHKQHIAHEETATKRT